MNSHKPLAALALALLAAAASASAATPSRTLNVLELVIEARARDVSLPASETGGLRVTPCWGCKAVDLRASAATSYWLDSQRVSLAQLRSAQARNPDAALVFFYGTRTGLLNRVRMELPRGR